MNAVGTSCCPDLYPEMASTRREKRENQREKNKVSDNQTENRVAV